MVAGTSTSGTHLKDNMYGRIIAEIMSDDDNEESITMFLSVMGQILTSLEPLPMTALTAMRMHFPCGEDDRDDVNSVIGHLAFAGVNIADYQTFTCPFHPCFYDFLMEKSRSRKFFIRCVTDTARSYFYLATGYEVRTSL
ncbi:hypothetical protein BDR05DRAFT_1060412 [Suillus weaverae]|nr:hypothetical protein BDR05DRAFT_1060412 [Suillus weaverae]